MHPSLLLPEQTSTKHRSEERRYGEDSEELFVSGIQSYIMLNKHMYQQQHVQDENNNQDHNPHNITVLAPKTKPMSAARKVMEDLYALEEEEKDAILARAIKQLNEVLDLMTLQKGCVQHRISQYLADGKFDESRMDVTSCGNAYHVCTRIYLDMFWPISREDLVLWFKNVEGIPCDDTADNILTKIWNKEHWVRTIFDVMQSPICRYQVEGLFLQMIVAKLIGIERRNVKLSWII